MKSAKRSPNPPDHGTGVSEKVGFPLLGKLGGKSDTGVPNETADCGPPDSGERTRGSIHVEWTRRSMGFLRRAALGILHGACRRVDMRRIAVPANYRRVNARGREEQG